MNVKPAQGKLLLCLLLCGLGLAAYWPVTRCGFVDFDDPVYVTENLHVQGGLTLEGVAWAFSTAHSANWFPLTWLSHELDVQLYGLRPAGHHLTSLFFHLANTVLLFLLFNRMTGALWRSALVAALFALHPTHVESVAWVSERKDVLSTFFFLLTLMAYAGYAEGRRQNAECRMQNPASRITHHASRFYVLALFFFALGLMCKPMLVTLPFVLVLLDWWPLGRRQNAECRRQNAKAGSTLDAPRCGVHALLPLLTEKVPFFALAAVSSVVTYLVQRAGGATVSTAELSLSGRAANVLVAYVSYLGKLVWPANLAVFYPRPTQWPVWQVAGSGLLLGAITVLAVLAAGRASVPASLNIAGKWGSRGRSPSRFGGSAGASPYQSPYRYVAMGWFWFLGTLVPVIGLVQVGEQAMADRYTYIPYIGLFVVIAWGAEEIGRRSGGGRAFQRDHASPEDGARGDARPPALVARREARPTVVVAVVVCALGALLGATRKQAQWWQSSETLFRHTVAVTENNPLAQDLLGSALCQADKLPEAERHFREALRLKPDFPDAQINYALALDREGKFAEAVARLTEVLRQNPRDAHAHFSLGSVFERRGDTARAIGQYRQTLDRQPDCAEAHFALAAIYREKAEGTTPKAEAQGDTAQAIAEYRAGLRLKPDDPEALNNLAWVRAAHPDPAFRDGNEAVRLARRACELTRYQRPILVGTLAAAYAEAGRFDEAIATAQKARALALAAGQKELADKNRKLLELYQAHQAYHE